MDFQIKMLRLEQQALFLHTYSLKQTPWWSSFWIFDKLRLDDQTNDIFAVILRAEVGDYFAGYLVDVAVVVNGNRVFDQNAALEWRELVDVDFQDAQNSRVLFG